MHRTSAGQRLQPEQGGREVAVGSTQASSGRGGSLQGSDFWKGVLEESKAADIDSLPYEQRQHLEQRLRLMISQARFKEDFGYVDTFING